MNKIKTIGLVLPSGNIKDNKIIKEKISILEKKFKIKKFYNENFSKDYLSDYDEKKVEYFEQAFKDDEVDLILPIRGGYGAIRIVDKINYDLIKNNNKIFVGSSDISILLISLFKKTNTRLFHSLMVTNGFVENLDENIKIIENEILDLNLEKMSDKNARGILWGGNLSSLVSMFSGEQYLPDEDIILFLEDLEEPKYKIDKMLFEIYRNQELKEKIKGIIFGDFYMKNSYEQNDIKNLLEEFSIKFNVPCFLTKDITHKNNNKTIPFGKFISL